MDTSLILVVVSMVLSVINGKRSDSSKSRSDIRQTNKLYNRLLADYNKDVRPVSDNEDTLEVQFGVMLIEVLDIIEDNGHMTTNMWLKMGWRDVSLQWDPSDFGGVNQIHIPAKDIWLPDVIMFNGFESFINKDLDVVVSSDGTVMWVPPALIKLTCRHEFKGNTWVCPMKFGSWTYNGDEVEISPFGGSTSVDTNNYISGDQWQVVEANGIKKELQMNGSNYPIMEYVLRLKNKMLGRMHLGK